MERKSLYVKNEIDLDILKSYGFEKIFNIICKQLDDYEKRVEKNILINLNIEANNYLSVSVNNLNKVIIKTTESLSSKVIFLGSNFIQINSISSTNETLDLNGVYWH